MKKLLLLLFLIPLISCTEDWTGEKENIYLQDRNGIKYEVNSEVGFTGKYVEYFENGQKHIEEHLKLGKRNGLMTKWYENGQKEFKANYKNGKSDGLMTKWYENGQKESEINSKNGEVVDGVVTIWNKEGDVTETETYKDGKLVSSNNRLFKNIVDKILDELEN